MNLVGLHLQQNKLTGIPLELKKVTTLQKLDVSDNMLKAIKKRFAFFLTSKDL
jgi:Leucine-rich repeat (LRR) protein